MFGESPNFIKKYNKSFNSNKNHEKIIKHHEEMIDYHEEIINHHEEIIDYLEEIINHHEEIIDYLEEMIDYHEEIIDCRLKTQNRIISKNK
jgi:uncharacterized coiled-coil DUF342 family protein